MPRRSATCSPGGSPRPAVTCSAATSRPCGTDSRVPRRRMRRSPWWSGRPVTSTSRRSLRCASRGTLEAVPQGLEVAAEHVAAGRGDPLGEQVAERRGVEVRSARDPSGSERGGHAHRPCGSHRDEGPHANPRVRPGCGVHRCTRTAHREERDRPRCVPRGADPAQPGGSLLAQRPRLVGQRSQAVVVQLSEHGRRAVRPPHVRGLAIDAAWLHRRPGTQRATTHPREVRHGDRHPLVDPTTSKRHGRDDDRGSGDEHAEHQADAATCGHAEHEPGRTGCDGRRLPNAPAEHRAPPLGAPEAVRAIRRSRHGPGASRRVSVHSRRAPRRGCRPTRGPPSAVAVSMRTWRSGRGRCR